jgi:hypothetical protein
MENALRITRVVRPSRKTQALPIRLPRDQPLGLLPAQLPNPLPDLQATLLLDPQDPLPLLPVAPLLDILLDQQKEPPLDQPRDTQGPLLFLLMAQLLVPQTDRLLDQP